MYAAAARHEEARYYDDEDVQYEHEHEETLEETHRARPWPVRDRSRTGTGLSPRTGGVPYGGDETEEECGGDRTEASRVPQPEAAPGPAAPRALRAALNRRRSWAPLPPDVIATQAGVGLAGVGLTVLDRPASSAEARCAPYRVVCTA